MNDLYNPKLIGKAQKLRREMTKDERKLWYMFLRTLPKKFVRQKVFNHYIADFYCAEAKLVIELDGSQHYDEKNKEYDAQRDAYFAEKGIKVVRYSNYEIAKNFSAICADIAVQIGLE